MNIAIIGLGLIGGSIARGLLESGFAACIYGADTDEATLDLAFEREIIQGKLNPVLHGPEIHLWVFAVPPAAFAECLANVLPYAHTESALTDTLSIKKEVHQNLPEAIRRRFVGGHPMSGRKEAGLTASRPDLFVGMPWIICPGDADDDAQRRVTQLVHSLDADPVVMSPEDHDAHVALLSHLPHALANLLTSASRSLQYPQIAGPSWQDATRVAGSNPELWSQILSSNRHDVIHSLRMLQTDVSALIELLEQDDKAKIKNLIEGHPWRP